MCVLTVVRRTIVGQDFAVRRVIVAIWPRYARGFETFTQMMHARSVTQMLGPRNVVDAPMESFASSHTRQVEIRPCLSCQPEFLNGEKRRNHSDQLNR